MNTIINYVLPVLVCAVIISCKGNDTQKEIQRELPIENETTTAQSNETTGIPFLQPEPDVANPISQFVRRIFQDSKGNMWYGTNGDGVLFYDGKQLSKFSIDEGFDGQAVRGIVEDKDGLVWFATENGVIIYNPTISTSPTADSFSKFEYEDVLPHFDIWGIMIDSNDVMWFNTYMGAASYDWEYVRPFALPVAKKDRNRGVSHPKIVSSVSEDSKGNLWYATPGGAYKKVGASLEHVSEANGLPGSSVNQVLEDNNGDLWFATFYNGISRYDGKTYHNYTKDGTITGDEVWSLFKDKDGNIWFPAENHGVYKYDGKQFTNYGKTQGLATNAIQCIFQDTDGVIWFGGYLGLFRLDGEKVVSVTKENLENSSEK